MANAPSRLAPAASTGILGLINRLLTLVGRQPWQIAATGFSLYGLALLVKAAVYGILKYGLKGFIMRIVVSAAQAVPGSNPIQAQIQAEMDNFRSEFAKGFTPKEVERYPWHQSLPDTGIPHSQILADLTEWKDFETKRWSGGQHSGTVYYGEGEILELQNKAYALFSVANPLHSDVFLFTRKMEVEVVAMTLNLFHGDDCCGLLTTGGTESILLSILAYRNMGRKRGITEPNIVCARTAHPAFTKACMYFGIERRNADVDSEYRAVPANLEKLIDRNTVAMVCSYVQYPHGVGDPIAECAAIAQRHSIGFHTDCCLGSFLVALMEECGYKTEPFDFQVPGVTTISADTHKFGFTCKGSSVVMFRTKELRSSAYCTVANWPGGMYGTATLGGSRAGGLVACTWAAMVAIGRDGYKKCVREIMQAARGLIDGINNIPELKIMGNPVASTVAWCSADESRWPIFGIGEAFGRKGWHPSKLQKPNGLHICLTYVHTRTKNGRPIWQHWISDLKEAVEEYKADPSSFKTGSTAMYASAADLDIVDDSLKDKLICMALDETHTISRKDG